MGKINFNQQMLNTIENPSTSVEELKLIDPIIRDNAAHSLRLFHHYYFITIGLIVAWFLISNSIVAELSFFDVKISNKFILLLAIPFISSITYYLHITHLCISQYADTGLKLLHRKLYPTICKASILELVTVPSFLDFESMRVRLSNDSLASTLMFLLITFSFFCLPILAMAIINISLLLTHGLSWFSLLPILYFFCLFKSISNIIFCFKQVQN